MKKIDKAINSVNQIEFFVEYSSDKSMVVVKKLYAKNVKDAINKVRKTIGNEAEILSVSAI